jgi:hypothetical protein
VRNAYRIIVGIPEGKISLGDPDENGKTLLKWILKPCGVRMWTG